jgi:metal-responsive CopG/Arc/MetJ family transcriptional regulator
MGRVAKISISMPDELLRQVERVRSHSRETRSDFFRRAAETVIRQEEEKEAVERYVQSYIDQPEAEEEIAWAELGKRRLAEVPWS